MKHLVVTVHGIRTFGGWQERLEKLLREALGESEELEAYNYKFGYFSVLAFLLPPVRWMVTRGFRRRLQALATLRRWDRIDLVAHSFGTHLTGWGLHGIAADSRPRVHTIVMAGSVLKPGFPWRDLLGSSVGRVVNECGTRDGILLLNQLFVLFTGMAGRVGFSGMTGRRFRNRFFALGHSGYFLAGDAGDPDAFMRTHWLPLLTGEGEIPEVEDPRSTSALSGLATFLLNNSEPVKLSAYAAIFLAAFLWVFGLYREADRQREIAVARELGAQALLVREQRGRGQTLSGVLALEALRRLERRDAYSVQAGQALASALEVLPKRLMWRQVAGLYDADLSADGEWLAVIAGRGASSIWHVPIGRLRHEIANPDREDRFACGLGGAGRYLVILSNEPGTSLGRVTRWQVWDVGERRSLGRPVATETDLEHLAVDARGRFFAVADHHSVDLIRLPDLAHLATFRAAGRIAEVAFDESGAVLRIDSGERPARQRQEERRLVREVWRLDPAGWSAVAAIGPARPDPERTLRISLVDRGPTTAFRLSADGRRLVTSDKPIDGRYPQPAKLRLWHRKPGARAAAERSREPPTFELVTTHELARGLADLRFSSDGSRFATGGTDYTARVWDSRAGRQIARIDHGRTVRRVAFDGSGARLVSVDRNDRLGLWSLELSVIDRRHDSQPVITRGLAFSKDGRLLAVVTSRRAEIWEMGSGRLLYGEGHVYPRDGNEPRIHPHARSPRFVGQGRTVVFPGKRTTLLVDLESLGVRGIQHASMEGAVAVDPSGGLLAGSDGEAVSLISLSSDAGSVAADDERFELRGVRHLGFDVSGRFLAALGKGMAIVRDLEDRRDMPLPWPSAIERFAFSPTEPLLAVAGAGLVRLFALPGRSPAGQLMLGSANRVRALAFGPGGHLLAAIIGDQRVEVWDLGQQRMLLGEEVGDVLGMSFEPSGDAVAVSARNEPVRVWTGLGGGEAKETLRVFYDDSVWSTAFQPGARRLASASSDDLIHLTPFEPGDLMAAARARLPRNLDAREWASYLEDEPYRCTLPTLPPCAETGP